MESFISTKVKDQQEKCVINLQIDLTYGTTSCSLLPITKYERTGCGSALQFINMHVPTTAQRHNAAWAPLWLVRSVNVVGVRTRKVLPQWPQTTLMPSGWMGRAGWAGCSSGMTITGLRLMMRLLSEETKKRTSLWVSPINRAWFERYQQEVNTQEMWGTYQFGRGHPILLDVSLQMSRQLQGHLTYFFPVGGFLMGWKATHRNQLTE